MKQLFIAALLAVTVVSSAFAAGPLKINYSVLNTFNSQFSKAANVSWSSSNEYVKAVFTLSDQKYEAFFDANGELIGQSTNIKLDELPVSAKRTFAKKFSGYTVKEAIRFEGVEEGAYYISGENEKESVILKVNDNSQVSVFKKTSKC